MRASVPDLAVADLSPFSDGGEVDRRRVAADIGDACRKLGYRTAKESFSIGPLGVGPEPSGRTTPTTRR